MADYRGMGENPPLPRRGIGDELVVDANPDEPVGDWAHRVVNECRAYGGATKATFNGVTIHCGTSWTPEAVLREWDRKRLAKLSGEGRFILSSPSFLDREKTPQPRLNVLAEAARITSGDRQKAYGHPEQNLGGIADAWSAYLRKRYGADAPVLDARAVAMLNVLAKVIRDAHAPKRDNLIDICGYARIAEMLDEADE